MKYRLFGKTGWELSEIGFGCWGMGGGWGRRDDAQARAALTRALEAGVNFFDTAYVYGDGVSERLLGEMIRAWRGSHREPVYVATKVPAKTMKWPADPSMDPEAAFPADWIVRCTDTSLKRLGMEQVDLQQMHIWTDAWVEAEGWRRAVERLKKEGKIRAFGVSINDHEPDSALKLVASGACDSVQVIYNLFDQAPEDRLFPLAQEHGVGVIVRVPFDEGSLTGAFHPGMRFEPDDWRAGYFKGERLAETCARVDRLKEFLGEEAASLPELALKFALHHPAVSTVIPGMRRAAHVDQNARVSGAAPLSEELLRRLREHRWQRNFYVGAWD